MKKRGAACRLLLACDCHFLSHEPSARTVSMCALGNVKKKIVNDYRLDYPPFKQLRGFSSFGRASALHASALYAEDQGFDSPNLQAFSNYFKCCIDR